MPYIEKDLVNKLKKIDLYNYTSFGQWYYRKKCYKSIRNFTKKRLSSFR